MIKYPSYPPMKIFVSCYGTMMFNCLWGHGSLVRVVSELTSAVMGTCHTVTSSNVVMIIVTRRSVTALANQLISATGHCHAWHVTRDSTPPGRDAVCIENHGTTPLKHLQYLYLLSDVLHSEIPMRTGVKKLKYRSRIIRECQIESFRE